MIDPLGRPLDNAGPVDTHLRAPVECAAPSIMDRAPVTVPLATGTKVIDALIPVGRGQRELILGDRQTGKTALAIDCILNQKGKNVLCIYCAIGQRNSSVAKVIADLERAAPWSIRLSSWPGANPPRACVSSRPMPPWRWASISCARAAMR